MCFSFVPSPFSSAPLPFQQLQLRQLWLRLRPIRKAQKPENPGIRWPVLSGEFTTAGMLMLNIHKGIIAWLYSLQLLTFQHGRDSKGGHGNSQKSPPPKSSDFDKYSDYSDDKYDYDEEEDDYEDDMSEYPQSKDSGPQGRGRGRQSKDQMKRGSMRGMKQQQCMNETLSNQIIYVVSKCTVYVAVVFDFFFHRSQLGREEGAEAVGRGEDVGCSSRTRSWRANPGEDVDEDEEETKAWKTWSQWVCL